MILQSSNFIQNPIVSIAIITYNQDKYIQTAIESILSQITDFSYEIIIGEDCSTDNTRSICEKYQQQYPDKIKLLLQDQNKGVIKNYFEVLELCNGKYIAQCAGDDYWTDNYKIQKQVDFLNVNESYGLVYTSFTKFFESNEQIVENLRLSENETSFEELVKGNVISALTVCFKKSIFDNYVEEIHPLEKNWLMEDYPFWLWISLNYKIKYFPINTGVYRVLDYSVSNNPDPIKVHLFELSVNDVREYFALMANKIEIIQPYLNHFYVDTIRIFFANAYFGYELTTLKIKLKTYSKLTFLNKLKLFGLKNRLSYFFAHFFVEFYMKIKWIFC